MPNPRRCPTCGRFFRESIQGVPRHEWTRHNRCAVCGCEREFRPRANRQRHRGEPKSVAWYRPAGGTWTVINPKCKRKEQAK